MARLEYEITGDASSLLSSVNQSLGAFGTLQDTYDRLSQKAQQAGADSLALQGEILALKKSLDDGTISQAQYNQQLDQLSGFLRDTNGALAGYQQQLVNIRQATNDLNSTPISPDASQLAGVNAQLGSLQSNLFGSRRIAIDFTRAIAEAPVSVEGFARNLGLLAVDFLFYSQSAQFAGKATTAATAEIGAAQTASVATGGGLKNLGSAFSSLLTPINAVVLGIGVLAAGYVYFTKQSEEAAKAQKLVQEAFAKAFDVPTANLKILSDAINDTTLSMRDRINAAEELKKEFPEELANTSALTLVNGGLKDSYEAITQAIFKQASAEANLSAIKAEESKKALLLVEQAQIQAKAGLDIANIKGPIQQGSTQSSLTGAIQEATITVEQQKKGIQALADFRKTKIQPEIDSIDKVIQQLITNAQKDGANLAKVLEGTNKLIQDPLNNFSAIIKASGSKADFENLKKALEAELDSLAPSDSRIADLRAKILQVEEIIKNTYTVKIPGRGSSVDPFIAIGNTLDEIFNKTNKLANDSGLQGYALIVQKIKDEYIKINTVLDEQQKKLTALQSKGLSPTKQAEKDVAQEKQDRDRISSQVAEQKDLSDAKIAEASRVANEIQRINDEFGVKAEVSRGRELAQIQKRYDAEVVKAHGNADILDTLNKDSLIAIQAVDDKYIVQERQTYNRITEIADQAFQILATGEESRTDKINIQSQKRIDQANVEFNKLRDLAKGLPQSSTDKINAIQAQVDLVIKAANVQQVSEEISKNFASAMQSAVNGFVSNFYTALTTLGEQRQTIDDKYNQQLASATTDLARQQIERQRQIEQSATTSFGAVFSSLVDKFKSTFNTSILDSFTKQFTENLGKTLLAPSKKQLTISPEEEGAQKAAGLLQTAGNDLAAQIRQAGVDFASSIKTIQPGLLNGASGGSSPLLQASGISAVQSILTPALQSTIGVSGSKFSSAIEVAAITAGGTAIGTAIKAGSITTSSSEQAGNKISQAAAGLAAAASLAGGLISGLGKPTNTTTSALGGAVSGAGEGALIGSTLAPFTAGTSILVGAIAGFVIGGISGIFSASKAKKAEELQQAQLKQQQITNELLARQNALAYTSSIIGRMTTQGIITGADINAFGQLTATVSGKSIQFVLDRSNSGR